MAKLFAMVSGFTGLKKSCPSLYAVLIGDQALRRNNVPFAAALAMFFLLVTLILVLITVRLGREKQVEEA